MRLSLSLLALAAGTTAIAGCTAVGPDFHRPGSPASEYFAAPSVPGTLQAGAPRAQIGAGPNGAWWKDFGSSRLDRLVDWALRRNPGVEASNATLAAAREELVAARGRRLLNAGASASVEHQQVNLAGFGFEGDNPVFDLYSVGGGISYDLDLFGAQRRSVERVGAETEAQLHETEAAHLALAGQVVNQAFRIATVRGEIATARAIVDDDDRNLALTRRRFAAGEGTLVEVLSAQSQLASDAGRLPAQEQELTEARHMLATLLGEPPSVVAEIDFDLDEFTLPEHIPVSLPSDLVRKRPDILEAEAELHAATAAIGIATARLYPSITIGASVTQGATEPDQILSDHFRGFDLFGGLTAPLFHGGALRAQRRAAVLRADEAAARYRETILDAFRQIADLLEAIGSDGRSVSDRQQAVAIAARSLALSRRSFAVGNSGLLQVLDSERLHQQAQSDLVEARSRQLINAARLYVATAGGWTGPEPAAGH